MKRRELLVGSTIALSGTAIVGSGTFSRVESHREVRIEVVGDDDAYLRLVYGDLEFDCETTLTVVTAGNQLKADVEDVEFDLALETDDDVVVENLHVPESIPLGEEVEITADLACVGQGEATASFVIEVDGHGSTVETHRSERFVISCDCLFDGEDVSFVAFCAEDGDAAPAVSVEATQFKDDGGSRGGPVTVDYERTGGGEIGKAVVFVGEGRPDEKGAYFYDGDPTLPEVGRLTTREDVPSGEQGSYLFRTEIETEPRDTFGPGWQSDPCTARDEDDDIAGIKFDWDDEDETFVEG